MIFKDTLLYVYIYYLSIYLQVYSPLSSFSTSKISRLEIKSILLEGKKSEKYNL